MWEQHGRGRLGFEAYYTGKQRLDGNPYREESDAYWHLGLLGEITTGRFSWFINLENLLNVRQTHEDSLVLPARSPEGQWTTDVWSRLDEFRGAPGPITPAPTSALTGPSVNIKL